MKPQLAILYLLVTSFAYGAEVSFPEHNVSLTLPAGWEVGGQEKVEAMNAQLRSNPRTAKAQYYKMILGPLDTMTTKPFRPYILVQVINGSVPAETFVSMFPEIEPGSMQKTAELRKTIGLEAKAEKPYFDENTNTAVMPVSGINPEGQVFSGRSVFIPTKNKVIAFHLYADAKTGYAIFSEILPALQGANISQESKVSDEWIESARKYLLRIVTKRQTK